MRGDPFLAAALLLLAACAGRAPAPAGEAPAPAICDEEPGTFCRGDRHERTRPGEIPRSVR